MDALILSCGTGGGHNSAARAVKEELEAMHHSVVMMNPYTLHSHKLAETIDGVYISAARKAPKAFGAIYSAGELYRKLPFRSPVSHVNRRLVPVLQQYLEEHHFDIVIMPHLFPAEIMTNMKRRGIDIPKTMYIATDYCCIPFTEETECDAYVVPSAELGGDFVRRGIPDDKLYPYGIPVGSSFAGTEKPVSEKESFEACGIGRGNFGPKPDKKYILISGGSMGAGKIEKLSGMLLEKLREKDKDRETGIIAVCGSNRELYWKLKRRYGREIVVVGCTECMADYLRASSLYITKPGGLSSTEAAVCGIPLLHMPPIPGCESYNARYFREHRMSLACDVTEQGVKTAVDLLDRADICRGMVDSQQRHIRKDAADKIGRLAERLVREEKRREPVFCFRMGAGA